MLDEIPSLIGGRFELQQELTRTNRDSIWRGVDTDSGRPVTIRLIGIDSLPAATMMRLEHEVLLRQSLRSEHVADLLYAGAAGRSYAIIRDSVPGVSLAERLASGPLDYAETLRIGAAVFAALRDQHQLGLLHRGVRPSNVILKTDGPLQLVNFGPAAELPATGTLAPEELEIASYLSPEQSGVLEQDVAEPSDIYSAGILLYHCICGHPPFQSSTLRGLLYDHMTAPATSLRDLQIDVPRAFEELIQRALKKDPRDRYQSAEAVLADIVSLQQALERNATPSIVIGAHDHRRSLTEPSFVSRAREVGQLDDFRTRAAQGQPNVVTLEGESGAGKTRLLDETARRAAGVGFRVYRGRGTNDVAREPFQMLHGIVEGVLSDVQRHPPHGEFLREQLGEDGPVICTALPNLSPILGSTGRTISSAESFGEARTIEALAHLLTCLGTQLRPCLIILDDCQWADEQTHRLIRQWQDRISRSADNSYVQLIVAFRSEEVGPDHILRQRPADAHVALSVLTSEEVRQLALSMAGPLPDSVLETVVRLANGSPFMASAVLRGLVESGALVGSPGGWSIDAHVMENVRSSSHAGSLLSRRLDLLPTDTLHFLTWGAVLGSEFEIDRVARLFRQPSDQIIRAVDVARQRHLIWCRQDGAECVFVHDKIREVLLERQNDQERADCHRQAALDIEQHSPDQRSALSFHFDAAGMHREALGYALQAAEQASEQHALEIAEQQYLIARRGSAEANREHRFRIERGLGNVLMVRGRYAEAAVAFERAAEVADSTFDRAELQGKLAELALKRGDMEQAVSDYSAALRMLGTKVPRTEIVLLVKFLWEALVQGMHTALPFLFVHRRRRAPSDLERLKMRLFSGLSHGCWYCRSKLSVYWSHFRGMNLAEQFPPTLELAQIYADHAPAMTIIPIPAFRRGIRYAEKSLSIRQAYGDLWGQGQSLHYYGVVHYAASNYNACIERCRESIRILERLGDYWQVHIARYQIAASYFRMGNLDAALEEARLNHKSGLELGDEQASGIILDIWAWSTSGHVPPEILRRERARERHDAQGAAQVLCAQGVCQLREGDAAGAVESIEQAIQICNEAGVRNDYTRPLATWHATALRELAGEIQDITPATRQLVLQRGLMAARHAVAATRFYRNERPHALRELGLMHAMTGRVNRGLNLLNRSIVVATQIGADFEKAQSEVARLRLCRELRLPGAEEQLRDAELRVAEFLPAGDLRSSQGPNDDLPSLSLVDRFGAVLDAGRKIASALSKTIIFEETQAAASQLLRPEICLMVPVRYDGDAVSFDSLNCNTGRCLQESLLLEAVRCGRAITSTRECDGREDATSEEAAERSVLCAPILVRGRVLACLYVAHDNVSDLFGSTEERLADFITTIAGAALENAEGFESLQQLNATLERRVVDRTRVVAARAKELAESNEMLEQTAKRLRDAQAELIASKQQVELASEAKSRFLAAMSHEIRTPMNGIIGMAELALRTSLTDQQQGFISTIRESGGVLLSLLNDVLDFSKIEAGKMVLEQVPLSVSDIVGGCVRMLAGRAAEKKLELICRVSPDVPPLVAGDPSRLRQVLINLLGNAIKFTQEGEVLVHVWQERPLTSEASGESTVAIHLLVQDTGIGIPPEQQQAIFEAFNQANTSVTRQFGGTGLGLSISSELVNLMNGRMWVDSEPGVGSQFHVTVPLGLIGEAESPVESPRHKSCPPALLLSRNAHATETYREIIAGRGLDVVSISSAEEAQLAWYEARHRGERFSLIVLDAPPTEQVDTHLLHELRELMENQDCPLILLAPLDQMVSADHFRERGADQIVMKPVIPADLANCINEVLEQSFFTKAASATSQNSIMHKPLPSHPSQGHALRVLVADDSAVNREVASGLLEFLGHEVTLARNGREALELSQQSHFDAVFMDIEMPEMDGYEATRAIREAESITGRHLPIIAMSAHAADELALSGRDAGMDHYVSKPIEPAQIKYVLEHLDEFVIEPATVEADP